LFRYTRNSVEGKRVYDIGKGQWNLPALRRLLEDILPKNTMFEDLELEADIGKAGMRRLILNGRKLERTAGFPGMILLTMEEAPLAG